MGFRYDTALVDLDHEWLRICSGFAVDREEGYLLVQGLLSKRTADASEAECSDGRTGVVQLGHTWLLPVIRTQCARDLRPGFDELCLPQSHSVVASQFRPGRHLAGVRKPGEHGVFILGAE